MLQVVNRVLDLLRVEEPFWYTLAFLLVCRCTRANVIAYRTWSGYRCSLEAARASLRHCTGCSAEAVTIMSGFLARFLTQEVCWDAARRSLVPILAWAHQNNIPFDAHTARQAAESGELKTLQWLVRDHGCPWDVTATHAAALRGHAPMLKWAVRHGCPWDADTAYSAARSGNLALLRWIVQRGCPCDETACYAALSHVRVSPALGTGRRVRSRRLAVSQTTTDH